jgi:UDP-glucose 4-epimerase
VIIWVLGAGGLLGSAITRAASANQRHTIFIGSPLPWNDPHALANAINADAQRFKNECGDQAWAVIWAAGQAAVSSTSDATQSEALALSAIVTALAENLPAGRGTFFLSSSAGGVYAGSENPPFTISTVPRPLSAYGELKLEQEAIASRKLSDACSVIIGRFSNIYGPGQDLGKLQGLISRLALSAVTKDPINIFVSLDTLRDYIYVDDAARIVLALVERTLHANDSKYEETHIIASGQPVSLGHLINVMQDIARIRIPVAMGAHASAAAQSRDLRLIPTESAVTDSCVSTTLPAGTKAVYLDVLNRFQQATTHSA